MGSTRPPEIRTPVLAEERVMANVVTPYQTVHLALTASSLRIEWDKSLLGVLPIGESSLEVPLPDLEGIRIRHTVMPARLLVAIALGALPLAVDVPRWLLGFIVVLAIWFLLVAVIGAVEISFSGQTEIIPVCLLQKRTTAGFIEQVWQIAGTTHRALT